MPYTNCASCGAKALVGATRCPRCEAPFVSYDVQGKRVPTVNCPTCGVQRPAAIGACPNCFTSAGHSATFRRQGAMLVAAAILVIIGVGYLASRSVVPVGTGAAPASEASVAAVARDTAGPDSTPVFDSTSTRFATEVPAGVRTKLPPLLPGGGAPVTGREATAPAAAPAAAPVRPTSSLPSAVRPGKVSAVPVSDTGSWVNAMADTWVRMRSAPSADGDVLRVIDSAQRVRLGPPVAGWRPVRIGTERGWVDRRYFHVVPAPRP